jgi:hypothetical protein
MLPLVVPFQVAFIPYKAADMAFRLYFSFPINKPTNKLARFKSIEQQFFQLKWDEVLKVRRSLPAGTQFITHDHGDKYAL